MKSALTVATVLTFAACATLHEHHIGPDTIAAEAAFAVLTVVDGLQSQNAVRACAESNPVIGRCGERVAPASYYSFVIAAHAVVIVAMPERWRPWFVGTSLGIEADQVWENHALGYHIDGTYTGAK